MGEAFGSGFQYGKRRISAMSNEEFNKLSPKQLHIDMSADIKSMIPSMTKSMDNFATLQPVIIKELLKYVFDLAPAVKDVIAEKAIGGELLDTSKILSPALNQAELLKAILDLASNALNIDTTGGGITGPIEAEARRGGTQQTTAGPPTPPPIAITSAQALAIALAAKKEAQVHGPQITAKQQAINTQIANQPNNTIVIAADGTIINKDVRKPPTRPRAPKSIVTQVKKLQEELKSINVILGKLTATSFNKVQVQKFQKIKIDVIRKIGDLQRKYQF